MLLNLTHHASVNWPQNQKETAIKKYGMIQDLFFPQIDPKSSEAELDVLVNKYVEQIRVRNPRAVHIMGEMTFVYRLVNSLKNLGITCIASTTLRNVKEEKDGTKTSSFQFVKFREY